MSIEEIRSLVSRARRSLSSSRILLDHGDDDRRDGDYGNRFPSRKAVEARIAEAAGFVESPVSLLEGRGIDCVR